MKITMQQLEEAIELIQEWTDYDVETNGYRDYDVVPSINKDMMGDLLKGVNKILKPKAKWW